MKLDGPMADWILSRTEWWLREFGPASRAQLVLPTDEYFPSRKPETLLEAVLFYADMEEGWEFQLEDESEGAAIPDPLAGKERPASPVAARRREVRDSERPGAGQVMIIPYDKGDTDDPAVCIRVLATGVSFYLLQAGSENLPDGERNHEALVELGAVMLGFGVILANTASQFERFQDGLMAGWRSAQTGNLGEDALGYAIALFVALTGEGEKDALRHLRPNPKAAFKAATKEFARDRRDEIERLRAIEPRAREGGAYR
jgi:hypothetical protein